MVDTPNQNNPSNQGEENASRPPIALDEGTVLREEYRVAEVLGMGSFGITYRAVDQHLQAGVAIKEYYPRHIAGRSGTSSTVQPHSSDATEEFEYGLEQFIEEGRTIARFDHPNVVDVRSYFEENGTGYLVMDYYEGQSLSSYLDEHGGRLPEAEAVDLMQGVLSGLQRVHEGGVLHRDIDPQNVYRTTEGEAILIDFGAAREAVGQRSQQLSVILKPGYAPIEQYSAGGDQGPHTDVYACAATLYRCLTGIKPPEATDRMQDDELEAPREVRPEVSFERSVAVMKGLAVRAEERPGSAEEFAALLSELPTEAGDTVGAEAAGRTAQTTEEKPASGLGSTGTDLEEETSRSWFSLRKIGLAVTAVLLVGVGVFFYPWVFSSDEAASGEKTSSEATERSVAVLPFEVSGSGAQAWRDGMVTMLSMNLDGAGGLRAIPDRRIFAAAEQVDSSALGNQSPGLAVAERAGARYAVVGSAVQIGETLRLGVEIHAVGSGKRLGQIEVDGAPDSVTVLTDRLTRQILSVILDKSEERIPSVDFSNITTSSLEAMKSFLAGERHLRKGESDAAVDDFKAAIREDSTFALPYARIGLLDLWQHESWGQYVQKAHELSGRLPRRTRRLIDALYVGRIQRRDVEAAERFRELTEDYPEDPSVWSSLGEFIAHAHIPNGLPEVEQAHEQAIELDPGNVSYYDHYVGPAFKLHHDSAMAARRIQRMPDGKAKRWYQNVLHLVFGVGSERERALSRLDTISVPQFVLKSADVTSPLEHPTDLALADTVFRKLFEREDLADLTYGRFLFRLAFYRGRVNEVLKRAEDGTVNPSTASLLISSEATLGIPLPERLERLIGPENLPEPIGVDALPLTVASGFYLAAQGRNSKARSLLRQFRSVTDTATSQPALRGLYEGLETEMEGYLAFQADSLQKARRLWKGSNQTGYYGAIWRGDLYRELDQLEQAEDWYLAAWAHPVTHERLGKLYEEMENPEKARAAYRRFIEAWTDADPALHPRVEKARERLTALGGPSATE